MNFAIIEAMDEDDVIEIASLDRQKKVAAHRKATQRREFASLIRSIKILVRETA